MPDSLLPEQAPANRCGARLAGMDPDAEQSHEQTVTRYEEPGNANLEPVPPLVPKKQVAEWVAQNSPKPD
jgi:hypothetical protein